MQLTERQQDVLAMLQEGHRARDIADQLGVSRNAVYQQIDAMKRKGALPADYTASGQPAWSQVAQMARALKASEIVQSEGSLTARTLEGLIAYMPAMLAVAQGQLEAIKALDTRLAEVEVELADLTDYVADRLDAALEAR